MNDRDLDNANFTFTKKNGKTHNWNQITQDIEYEQLGKKKRLKIQQE